MTESQIAIARRRLAAMTSAAAVLLALAGTPASGTDMKYPDWESQWRNPTAGRGGNPWDPTKPMGLAQQAPLTPEYQAILQASVADQAAGGPGNDPTYTCLAPGMPRVMNNYEGMELVITPNTTHMLMEHIHDSRRVFTDGRPWPKDIDPTFAGYSIGKWVDEGNTGHYNVLEIETRGFKGPRTYDNSGLPLHADNESVIHERIFQDKANKDRMYDEITTEDHALTHPWSATKIYRRAQYDHPVWHESVCAENNPHVEIAGQGYMLSADGFLMPAKKDQPPPDLKYFKKTGK